MTNPTTVYAALPKPHRVLHETVFIEDVEVPVFSEQQMHRHADETHALRTRDGDFILVRAEDLRAMLARPVPADAAEPITEQHAYDMGAKGAPATNAERLLFEAWMRGHCWKVCGTWDGTTYSGSREHADYIDPQVMLTHQLWAAWRDRSALGQGGPAGSGGWQRHAEAMERERDHYRQRAQAMHEHQDGQCWYWQGDGNDHPESMVNSLPVVIRADALRALMATPAMDSIQAAADAASVGHLSHLMDHQTALLSRAMAAMKAVELTASAFDESDGDFDARIPADDWAVFVNARAALLHDVAQSPVAAPTAVVGPVVAYRISDPNEPDLGHWLSEEPGASWCKSEPLIAATPTTQAAPVAQGDALDALQPFAEIGAWLFARNLPDDTALVKVHGINATGWTLTRGHFKAAALAARAKAKEGGAE